MTTKQVNKPRKSPLKRVYLLKRTKSPAPGVKTKVVTGQGHGTGTALNQGEVVDRH